MNIDLLAPRGSLLRLPQHTLAALLAALTIQGSVNAQIMVYEFTGTVQESTDPSPPEERFRSPVTPYGGVTAAVGDRVTGQFRYDLTAVDRNSSTNLGVYVDGVPCQLIIQVNGYTVTQGSIAVWIRNDDTTWNPDFPGDEFTITGVMNWNSNIVVNGEAFAEPAGEVFNLQVFFWDRTFGAFSSDALPGSLKLEEFGMSVGLLQHRGTNTPLNGEGIDFRITSLRQRLPTLVFADPNPGQDLPYIRSMFMDTDDQLTLFMPTENVDFRLEGSEDLVNWQRLGDALSLAENHFLFKIPDWQSHRRHFYRVIPLVQ